MKKYIFLILLLFSCEKSREIECWTCRWETRIIEFNAYYSTCRDTCLSEGDIRDYEKSGTWITDKQKNKITCWRQGEPAIWEPGF